ncbi:MAG: pectate lyase [Gammaproteobacteria bacterium]|nr:MAG: pectate lyase [Gammaproteobacteria bacterium]
MFAKQTSNRLKNEILFSLKTLTATMALLTAGSTLAASTGGFSTTDGGNVSGAKSFSASTYQEINSIIANAFLDSNGSKVSGGAYPVVITYTGNEDSLINQIIKDSTVDSSGKCSNPHWDDAFREVQIKEFTKGITIIGANGSSANFGITIIKSGNVVVRNMKIGALGGASNDADMLRVDTSSNVWLDHNELFAVNNECAGSPDGDLTFESAIDIKKDSHNITVSYNYIHDSKKVGLDGSSSSDIAGGREITFHHNIYKNVNARLPLQRGGWTHMYNNLYDGITGSGINVRQAGYALIEKNWFQNSVNPITCRYDSSNCGFWDLRNNNVTSPGDFATYNITWTSGGTIDATNWTTTAPFPISIPYSYSAVTPQCVKDKLGQVAGVGKNEAQLTSSTCSGTSSSSVASSIKSSVASSVASSVRSSVASSVKSSVSSSVASSKASSIASSVSSSVPTGQQCNWYGSLFPLCVTTTNGWGWEDNKSCISVSTCAGQPAPWGIVGGSASSTSSSAVNSSATSSKPASSVASSKPASSSSKAAFSSSASAGPVLSGTGDYPSGFSKCADLGETCSVTSGDGWVAFGRKGQWVTKRVSVPGTIGCTVSAFGSDPQGNPNKCSYKR